MNWDESFFIPKNNLFSKKWKTPNQIEEEIRLVSEFVKDNLCCSCGTAIGDVSEFFYEINEEYYCSKCGFVLILTAQTKDNSQKGLENLINEE
jgi:hypothetical protein